MYLNKQTIKSAVYIAVFVFTFLGYANFSYALTILQSDLNKNGIPDSGETDVVMQENATLSAGEYNFNNLTYI